MHLHLDARCLVGIGIQFQEPLQHSNARCRIVCSLGNITTRQNLDLEKSDVRNRDVQNRFYSCKTGKSKTEVEEVGVGWGGAWWRVVVYM